MALRLNLSLKFFLAFLLTSLTIVVLMIVIMQYCAYRNFSDYVRTMEEYRLNELTDILSEEYQLGQGWENLLNNNKRWRYFLRPRHPGPGRKPSPPPELASPSAEIPKHDRQQDHPPDDKQFQEDHDHRPPPRSNRFDRRPPPDDERFQEGRGRRPPPPRNDRFDRRPPPPGEKRFQDRRGKRRGPPPDDRRSREASYPGRSKPPRDNPKPGGRPPRFGIERRLTLFDSDKNIVVGPAPSPEGHTLKKIIAGDQTVGWLGLKKETGLTQPLDVAFLKQQAQAFYITGALMLTLAAIAACLFARHLLAPVKQLTAGTRALASRNFETRIKVNSNDELGQLAADFNQMARTLEGYEQLRHQWISDIAHELRTPLSVLQGEVEALQDGVRQITPESLGSLHAEIAHLSRLVRDLHDLSLADSGALHYSLAPVAPAALLRDAIKQFRPRFEGRNLTLLDELGSDVSYAIPGDRSRLVQVFSNLLENSLRYTEPPGTLKVRSDVTKAGIILHLEDTAPGVPAASLARLFDRLYRVDKSRSRTQGGSGLGLAICKSIIEAHGGTIRARQSDMGGMDMKIILPPAPADKLK
ncbi:MAG: HAMP domain-containing protein [Deltaproteobacteria bacterium]|nr:HAMP domain-containing protein [Deltaproteobacteria bacterium]